jgi:hypothetical protein
MSSFAGSRIRDDLWLQSRDAEDMAAARTHAGAEYFDPNSIQASIHALII